MENFKSMPGPGPVGFGTSSGGGGGVTIFNPFLDPDFNDDGNEPGIPVEGVWTPFILQYKDECS